MTQSSRHQIHNASEERTYTLFFEKNLAPDIGVQDCLDGGRVVSRELLMTR